MFRKKNFRKGVAFERKRALLYKAMYQRKEIRLLMRRFVRKKGNKRVQLEVINGIISENETVRGISENSLTELSFNITGQEYGLLIDDIIGVSFEPTNFRSGEINDKVLRSSELNPGIDYWEDRYDASEKYYGVLVGKEGLE